MKTLLTSLFIVLLMKVGAAQKIPEAQVPPVVLKAFQSKFPGIKEAKWEVKDEVYKVQCEFQSREHDLWLDKNGIIKKHKQDFPKKELPQAIVSYVNQHFKEYKIDDADKITAEGKVFYEVDIEKKPEDRRLLFSEEGALIENKLDWH